MYENCTTEYSYLLAVVLILYYCTTVLLAFGRSLSCLVFGALCSKIAFSSKQQPRVGTCKCDHVCVCSTHYLFDIFELGLGLEE